METEKPAQTSIASLLSDTIADDDNLDFLPAHEKESGAESIGASVHEFLDGDTDAVSRPQHTLSEAWKAAIADAGGLRAELLGEPFELQLVDSCLHCTLTDRQAYEFSQRHGRVAELQLAVSRLIGANISIVFHLRQLDSPNERVKAPKMNRTQTIRMLTQNNLVKCAIDLFDAEVLDYREN
jgi:hypothetical protein